MQLGSRSFGPPNEIPPGANPGGYWNGAVLFYWHMLGRWGKAEMARSPFVKTAMGSQAAYETWRGSVHLPSAFPGLQWMHTLGSWLWAAAPFSVSAFPLCDEKQHLWAVAEPSRLDVASPIPSRPVCHRPRVSDQSRVLRASRQQLSDSDK